MDQNVYKQELTLIIVDKICATASLIGSVFIIRDVKKRWDRKKSNEYLPPTLYLLAHTAIGDIGYSFFPHFLGSWLLPKETGYPLAAGNQATCTAQGYLMFLFFGAAASFRCVLALTYWLTVCRGKQESELRSRYWTFVLYYYSWASSLGLPALSWTVLIPSKSGGWPYCMVVCGREPFGSEPNTKWFKVWGITGLLYFVASMALTSFFMISLVRFVHHTEKRMGRFAVDGDSDRQKKSIAATRQGLLYIMAQQFALLPIVFWIIFVILLDQNMPMWAWTLTACMKTLPGFLHSVIHFQPKYSRILKRGNISRLNALATALDITVPGPGHLLSLTQSGSGNVRGSGQGSLPSQVNQSTNCELPASLPQQPKDDSGECGGT